MGSRGIESSTDIDLAMAKLVLQGMTLQQIADAYGVSRQRVQQRISRIGVSGHEGQSLRASRRRLARRITTCAHCGVTYERSRTESTFHRHKSDPLLDATIIAAYQMGIRTVDIADGLGIHLTRVFRRLRANGAVNRNARRPFRSRADSAAIKAKILDLASNSSLTDKEIGDEVGVTNAWVREVRRRAGIRRDRV